MSPNRSEPHDLLSSMETWKRTDYADSEEAKLIHTDGRNEISTEGDRQHAHRGRERERQEERMSLQLKEKKSQIAQQAGNSSAAFTTELSDYDCFCGSRCILICF